MLINKITNLCLEKILSQRLNKDILEIIQNKDNSTSFYIAKTLIFKLVDKNSTYIAITKNSISNIDYSLLDYNILKSSPNLVRFNINDNILNNTQVDFFGGVVNNFIDSYGGEPFECCSKYVECSDSKMCLHVDLLYAKSCRYRENLENNRIFYGKNKNI